MRPFGSSEVSIAANSGVSESIGGRELYIRGCWTAYCDGDEDRAAQSVPGQRWRFRSFLRTYNNSSSRDLGGLSLYRQAVDR